MELLSATQLDLFASIDEYILSLGDDVQRNELKLYVAYKRLKNFASIVPQKNQFLLYLNVNPDAYVPLPINGRDVRKIGHWATGDLEITLRNSADLDAAKRFIGAAYASKTKTELP